MFDTVLVANRGEIACRIIRTLHELGIRSVAVYSDADRTAKHVEMADAAVHIGPAAAEASYLNVEAIVAAAAASGAQAIHPGYGFLSESGDLARACEGAGIVFVGPDVSALEIMGDKIAAKNHVAARGVPIVPGVSEPGLSDDDLVSAALGVGFPLLVKPSAGGGGKGMTVVGDPAELAQALSGARRVAASAFGDDTLLLERLVTQPRHIEVQVLADRHGATVHLGERECSLQRRHQKIIEEAPSPLLDAATRARIGQAACEVARSVAYVGAGTVEFLVAAAAPEEFFFIEMNTRLQVEHPVTELVATIGGRRGLDLVELQLRIAAGEPLGFAQEEVGISGHAIEARVYAETPSRDFLPATGTVLALEEPSGEGIRVDSSLRRGLSITPDYDPMLAKIIAWAPDRAEAIERLDGALARTVILGVQTNIEFLRALLADPAVRSGRLDTGLIERALPGIRFAEPDDSVLTAAARLVQEPRPTTSGPWEAGDGWRLGEHRPQRFEFEAATTGSVHGAVSAEPAAQNLLPGARDGDTVWIAQSGTAFELRFRDRARRLAERRAAMIRVEGAADPAVRSPMPGTVVVVEVANGTSVATGQLLLTIEAMKMEHRLVAPMDGIVSLTVAPGDLVSLDQIVATITPQAGATEEGAQP